MKFELIVQTFRDRPFFESREVESLFDEPASQIQARLSRWVKQRRLIQLRRGRYILAKEYRREEPSLYFISNYLYRPSYVSLYSALEFHGLIPEAVGIVQAVTTRHGTGWDTPLGSFRYHSLKQDRFWGYREYPSAPGAPTSPQERFLAAAPEKAIMDLFYLYEGEWTEERIREARFQNLDQIDPDVLIETARKFRSQKVSRAVERFLKLLSSAEIK
ncbi:MAG: hypothetical protein ACE5MK_13625 [Acidobacteriota bacterium]